MEVAGGEVSGAGIQSVPCPDTARIQRSVLGPTLLQHSLIRPSHLQPHSPHTAAATARILHYSHLWGCSWITSVEASPGFISNTIIRYSYMTNDEDVVYSQSLRLIAGNYNLDNHKIIKLHLIYMRVWSCGAWPRVAPRLQLQQLLMRPSYQTGSPAQASLLRHRTGSSDI